MGLAQIQHGFDEVLAIDAEYPGNPYNEIPFQSPGNRQLTGQLGLSVDVQRRIVLAVRLPRRLSLTVENIIRAEV